LVNKAQWGSMNQEGVVPDRESVRNSVYAQQAYSRLAQALVNHNQFDSAVVVMDKYQEFFPNDKFPFDLRCYQFPEMYYICGDTLKGDQFMRDIAGNFSDKVEYYCNMKPKFQDYYAEDIEEGMSLLKHFASVAKKYEREELYDWISNKLTEYLSVYYME
jgi:hypothetical protein